MSTDDVWRGLAGLNLEGAGLIVGEWDGGAVHPGHPDTPNIIQVDGATEISGHATYVAGTLVGSGAGYYAAHGMVSGAQLNAWDWNDDTAEMATAAAGGLLVSNYSDGAATGWKTSVNQYPTNGGGSVVMVTRIRSSAITTRKPDMDQIAYDAPTYLAVKS